METAKTMPEKPVDSPPSRPPLAPAVDPDRHPAPARVRNPRFRMFLILGGVVLAVVGLFLWRYFSSYESTDDAQIDGHVNSISARVAGHVIKLNVQDNHYVQAGTVLAEIDPTDYQVAVERAQADYNDAKAGAEAANVDVPITATTSSSQLSSAEADVLNAQAGIKAARQQAAAAQANLEQAEANNVKAQNDLQRYKQLVEKQEM